MDEKAEDVLNTPVQDDVEAGCSSPVTEQEINQRFYEFDLEVNEPRLDETGNKYKRAFYEVEQAPVVYNGHLFQFNIITTEEFIPDLQEGTSLIRGRNPCIRMLNQLDRVMANSPDIFEALVKMDVDVNLAGKTGVVIYAHGVRYFDDDDEGKSNPKWGAVVSKNAKGPDGSYFYSDQIRNDPTIETAPNFVDAREMLMEIQKDPKVGYILTVACNEAGIVIDPSELSVPLIQYTTANRNPGEISHLEIVQP